MSHHSDVKAFHQKFGFLTNDEPGHLSQRKLEERIKFLQEELDELKKAGAENDLADQGDALIDLVYVAIGTAVMMGLPWEDMWQEVHRANMEKVRGIGPRGNKVDCVKPEGWTPPQHDELLILNGYERHTYVAADGSLFYGRDDEEYK